MPAGSETRPHTHTDTRLPDKRQNQAGLQWSTMENRKLLSLLSVVTNFPPSFDVSVKVSDKRGRQAVITQDSFLSHPLERDTECQSDDLNLAFCRD